MKKIILFLLMNTSIVHAQHLDFFKFISIPDFTAYDVKQTSDGGYLIAGGMHNINGGDFVLVKVDSMGNQSFVYTNDRFNGMDGSNIIYSLEIADRYIYLAGGIKPFFGYPQQVYIVKLDSLFNKIWEIQDTGLGGISAAEKIKLTKDGNLIVTGSASYSASNNIYAAKIDTAGNFRWKNYFSFNNGSFGRDIIDLEHNKYIICGLYSSSPGPIDTMASIIFNFDSTGSINWYNDYPDTISNGFSSVINALDGNIYCGQYYAPTFANPANPNSAIFKFDSSGNMLFRKDFLNSNSRRTYVFEKANQTLIAAYDFLYVLFLNSNGDSIASYRNPDYLMLKNSILDEQERIVLVGHYQPNVGWPYTSYIMRVSDTVVTGIDGIQDILEVRIYPNPSNGLFTVIADNLSNAIEHIEIYSVDGKKILGAGVRQPFSTLDLSYLANGIYFLKITILNNAMPVVKPIIILKQ